MIWFLIVLVIIAMAADVYVSVTIMYKLLQKITKLEEDTKDLFENDDWCESSIQSLFMSDEAFKKELNNEYDLRMSDISKVWRKMDELNNDINRAKMRIGKLEQGELAKIEPIEFGDGARIDEENAS